VVNYVTDKKRKALEEAGETTESEKKVKMEDCKETKAQVLESGKNREAEVKVEDMKATRKKKAAETEGKMGEEAGRGLIGYGIPNGEKTEQRQHKQVGKEDGKVKKAAIAYAYMSDGKTTGTEILNVLSSNP
jgi:hypothetical protein